jgi:hypothetical protein
MTALACIIGYALVILFAWSLCQVAGRADEQMGLK